MKREQLLKSKEYWIFQIQNALFKTIENYRKEKNYTKTQLANELGFNKSYITQILNGDFDHKISKLVELSLASGKAPVISFVDLTECITNDSQNKSYSIPTPLRPIQYVHFNDVKEEGKKQEYLKYHPKNIKFSDNPVVS